MDIKSLKTLGIYRKVSNEKIKNKYKKIIQTKEHLHIKPEISNATRNLLLNECSEIKNMNNEELFNYIYFNKLPPKVVEISTRIIYNNRKKMKQITKVEDGVKYIYIENYK